MSRRDSKSLTEERYALCHSICTQLERSTARDRRFRIESRRGRLVSCQRFRSKKSQRCNTYSRASLDQTHASLERRENFHELELRRRLDSSRGVGWFWGPFCRSVPGQDERCEREAADRSTRLMLYSSSSQHVSVDTGGVFYSEVCVVVVASVISVNLQP